MDGGAFHSGQEQSTQCDTKEITRLVKAGANIHAACALHMAAANGQSAAIKALHTLGGDPSKADQHGNAPLHVAAVGLQLHSIKALLECGVAADGRNSSGSTPLQLAAKAKTEAARFMHNILGGRLAVTAAAAQTQQREEETWVAIFTLLGGAGAAASLVAPPTKALAASSSGGKRSAACPQCHKVNANNFPENDPALGHRAFCAGCDEDLGCNDCWRDNGGFCEGCNVFECDGCARGWNNRYGPTGDVGVSCSD